MQVDRAASRLQVIGGGGLRGSGSVDNVPAAPPPCNATIGDGTAARGQHQPAGHHPK
ncbi:hypothetical protein [Marinobacterium arenosum]|uniref:hypothetical protein n=1 Tax=Marinobacterium arenosum TaxID=2862496 RepID=UPI001C95346A|nr:hypothetical protein [Marinobacterium arenosum]MBY4675256.1 hypothetical protein [Marinobacterium arenosum]